MRHRAPYLFLLATTAALACSAPPTSPWGAGERSLEVADGEDRFKPGDRPPTAVRPDLPVARRVQPIEAAITDPDVATGVELHGLFLGLAATGAGGRHHHQNIGGLVLGVADAGQPLQLIVV